MPTPATLLTVFVASPSDVSEERDLLEKVVNEINILLTGIKPIRLQLLRWETHASPSFGEDAQDVVNIQIPHYDIFVGILWHKIGSPTARAESGTIEEYEIAKERYDKDSNSVRLMVYFKTSPPLSLDNIDPEQLQGVKRFRTRIAQEGGLYAEFSTADIFESQIRAHLTKCAMEWPTEANNVDKTKEASTTDTRKDALYSNEDLAEEEFDDEGILDLADSFDEEVGAFSEVSERMAAIIEEVGNRARTRTTEYNTVQKSISEIKDASGERQLTIRQRQNIRKNARRVVNDSARDFDQFVDGMIRELPAFKQHLNGVMQTFARAVPLYGLHG